MASLRFLIDLTRAFATSYPTQAATINEIADYLAAQDAMLTRLASNEVSREVAFTQIDTLQRQLDDVLNQLAAVDLDAVRTIDFLHQMVLDDCSFYTDIMMNMAEAKNKQDMLGRLKGHILEHSNEQKSRMLQFFTNSSWSAAMKQAIDGQLDLIIDANETAMFNKIDHVAAELESQYKRDAALVPGLTREEWYVAYQESLAARLRYDAGQIDEVKRRGVAVSPDFSTLADIRRIPAQEIQTSIEHIPNVSGADPAVAVDNFKFLNKKMEAVVDEEVQKFAHKAKKFGLSPTGLSVKPPAFKELLENIYRHSDFKEAVRLRPDVSFEKSLVEYAFQQLCAAGVNPRNGVTYAQPQQLRRGSKKSVKAAAFAATYQIPGKKGILTLSDAMFKKGEALYRNVAVAKPTVATMPAPQVIPPTEREVSRYHRGKYNLTVREQYMQLFNEKSIKEKMRFVEGIPNARAAEFFDYCVQRGAPVPLVDIFMALARDAKFNDLFAKISEQSKAGIYYLLPETIKKAITISDKETRLAMTADSTMDFVAKHVYEMIKGTQQQKTEAKSYLKSIGFTDDDLLTAAKVSMAHEISEKRQAVDDLIATKASNPRFAAVLGAALSTLSAGEMVAEMIRLQKEGKHFGDAIQYMTVPKLLNVFTNKRGANYPLALKVNIFNLCSVPQKMAILSSIGFSGILKRETADALWKHLIEKNPQQLAFILNNVNKRLLAKFADKYLDNMTIEGKKTIAALQAFAHQYPILSEMLQAQINKNPIPVTPVPAFMPPGTPAPVLPASASTVAPPLPSVPAPATLVVPASTVATQASATTPTVPASVPLDDTHGAGVDDTDDEADDLDLDRILPAAPAWKVPPASPAKNSNPLHTAPSHHSMTAAMRQLSRSPSPTPIHNTAEPVDQMPYVAGIGRVKNPLYRVAPHTDDPIMKMRARMAGQAASTALPVTPVVPVNPLPITPVSVPTPVIIPEHAPMTIPKQPETSIKTDMADIKHKMKMRQQASQQAQTPSRASSPTLETGWPEFSPIAGPAIPPPSPRITPIAVQAPVTDTKPVTQTDWRDTVAAESANKVSTPQPVRVSRPVNAVQQPFRPAIPKGANAQALEAGLSQRPHFDLPAHAVVGSPQKMDRSYDAGADVARAQMRASKAEAAAGLARRAPLNVNLKADMQEKREKFGRRLAEQRAQERATQLDAELAESRGRADTAAQAARNQELELTRTVSALPNSAVVQPSPAEQLLVTGYRRMVQEQGIGPALSYLRQQSVDEGTMQTVFTKLHDSEVRAIFDEAGQEFNRYIFKARLDKLNREMHGAPIPIVTPMPSQDAIHHPGHRTKGAAMAAVLAESQAPQAYVAPVQEQSFVHEEESVMTDEGVLDTIDLSEAPEHDGTAGPADHEGVLETIRCVLAKKPTAARSHRSTMSKDEASVDDRIAQLVNALNASSCNEPERSKVTDELNRKLKHLTSFGGDKAYKKMVLEKLFEALRGDVEAAAALFYVSPNKNDVVNVERDMMNAAKSRLDSVYNAMKSVSGRWGMFSTREIEGFTRKYEHARNAPYNLDNHEQARPLSQRSQPLLDEASFENDAVESPLITLHHDDATEQSDDDIQDEMPKPAGWNSPKQ